MKFRPMLFVAAAMLSLALCASAFAQTPTSTLQYDIAAASTVVTTYQQAVTVDNVTVTAQPTCAPTTVGSTTSTTCSVPIATLTAGVSHTVSILFTLNGVTAETKVTGVDPAKGPASGTNPKLKVTLSYTFP